MIKLPFSVTDPSSLLALPPYYSESLFAHANVLSWYVGDDEYFTHQTLYDVDRLTGWADATPNDNDLTQVASSSFTFAPDNPLINNADGAKIEGTESYYDWPGTWPTGDHTKVFFFKAATPGTNRFLDGGGSGDGYHRTYISTLDRIIFEVDGAQATRTRDPSRWNLCMSSWDSTGRILATLVDQQGFESIATVGTADCGAYAPKIGTSNTGTTGAGGLIFREIGFLNVALHKSANATLLDLILGRFTTYYGIELAP
jgi:hypothetical protein